MEDDNKKIIASKKFNELAPKYSDLGKNIVQALEIFLQERKISFLSINYRVKEKESFIEKIERKKYSLPFEQIEDICGIRIICYYKNDIEIISQIIEDEFDIVERQDKEDLLETDQFGYRSKHFIVRINSKWLQAPNYRGLENLKAEIQIRTTLMHSWAEIEHKLSYKKEDHIPKELKRKFYRISAKLEEADEQFEELKNSIQNYKIEISDILKSEKIDKRKLELNLDSLQSFLDTNFPNNGKDISSTSDLLDEFFRFGITLEQLQNSYNEVKEVLPAIEKETFKNSGNTWHQVGVARKIMDLTNKNYFENRGSMISQSYKLRNEKWVELIKSQKEKK